jgi:hypothetical protein
MTDELLEIGDDAIHGEDAYTFFTPDEHRSFVYSENGHSGRVDDLERNGELLMGQPGPGDSTSSDGQHPKETT